MVRLATSTSILTQNGYGSKHVKTQYRLSCTMLRGDEHPCPFGGFHEWGIPKMDQNGWFVMENPNLKWMMTGGSPISGNLDFDVQQEYRV